MALLAARIEQSGVEARTLETERYSYWLGKQRGLFAIIILKKREHSSRTLN